MASSSKHLSDFLSSIGTKAGDKDNGEDEAEPDWLLESDEEEGSDREEKEEAGAKNDDPFMFLTTPIKLTSKSGEGELDEPATATPVQLKADGAGTPAGTPASTGKGDKRKAGAKSGAGVAVSGNMPVKNPDKIIFNRLLLEIPHMGDDSVDLSGDVGAVGRILMHAPDEDAAEPALLLPDGEPCDDKPATNATKTAAGDDPGTSNGAAEAAADEKRLQPDSEAAHDLADAPDDANVQRKKPRKADASERDDDEEPGSNGEATKGTPGGELARGTRRRASAAHANANTGTEAMEDDEMEDASEGYVQSEEESEGGSDGDYDAPAGAKQQKGAAKKGSSANGADNNGQKDKVANHEFILDLKGVMFAANVVQMPCTALVMHVGDSQAKVESVFNEFVQLEKRTVMAEYEEGDAEEGDYNLGGHGVDEDLPKDNQKPKKGKAKEPLISSSGRVAKKATKGKAKKGAAKKGPGAKRK